MKTEMTMTTPSKEDPETISRGLPAFEDLDILATKKCRVANDGKDLK